MFPELLQKVGSHLILLSSNINAKQQFYGVKNTVNFIPVIVQWKLATRKWKITKG
jgi:hypothetical protein